MEIPEINMITNFEAGMNCLQNPSLISRFFSFPGIENVFQVYSFCKWGALIFAIFATFSSLIKRIMLFFIRFHTIKPSLLESKEIDFREDDDISLGSSSDDEREDEEEEEEDSPTTSFRGQLRVDEDFYVKGSGKVVYRRRRISSGEMFDFDWSDFTSGKTVVKLWDSLSSSFNFGELDFPNFDPNAVVSDYYRQYDGFPLPAVILTAEGNANGHGVVLRGYDARARRRVPVLYAEWGSPALADIARIAAGGGSKVHVKGNGVSTVGDVRNVRAPLDSDGETWWDADAVIVDDEFVLV